MRETEKGKAIRIIVEIPCSSPPSLEFAQYEASELRDALDDAGWDTTLVRISVDQTTTIGE